MKKITAFLGILLFLGATFAVSQPIPGKMFEFSTAFSFSSYKFSDSTGSDSLLSLPLRFGYFFWQGLEIEPEFTLMKFSGSDTAYQVSGNLAYNFKLPGKIVPFVLGGAGFGNGFSIGPLVEGGADVKSFLLNAGAGLKFRMGDSAAIRMEYRFTRNRLTETGYEPYYINAHQVFIGVSLFF